LRGIRKKNLNYDKAQTHPAVESSRDKMGSY
jgi:hypothetical protein